MNPRKKVQTKIERNIMNKKKDFRLRLELVKQAGFSLVELPLVYQFVKGDDEALRELKEFRRWKQNRESERLKDSL